MVLSTNFLLYCCFEDFELIHYWLISAYISWERYSMYQKACFYQCVLISAYEVSHIAPHAIHNHIIKNVTTIHLIWNCSLSKKQVYFYKAICRSQWLYANPHLTSTLLAGVSKLSSWWLWTIHPCGSTMSLTPQYLSIWFIFRVKKSEFFTGQLKKIRSDHRYTGCVKVENTKNQPCTIVDFTFDHYSVYQSWRQVSGIMT